MVGAVENRLLLMGGKGGPEVVGQGHFARQCAAHIGIDLPLVVVGGAGGQLVGPHIGLGGDKTEGDGDPCLFGKLGHILGIVLQPLGVGSVKPGDEGGVVAEIDPVVLLLARQLFGVGFGRRPAVPAGELVGDIALIVGHKVPGGQRLDGEGGPLGQGAVFHLGKVPVGGEGVGGGHQAQKGAEKGGKEDGIFFGHGKTSFWGEDLGQNRKYKKGL